MIGLSKLFSPYYLVYQEIIEENELEQNEFFVFLHLILWHMKYEGFFDLYAEAALPNGATKAELEELRSILTPPFLETELGETIEFVELCKESNLVDAIQKMKRPFFEKLKARLEKD